MFIIIYFIILIIIIIIIIIGRNILNNYQIQKNNEEIIRQEYLASYEKTSKKQSDSSTKPVSQGTESNSDSGILNTVGESLKDPLLWGAIVTDIALRSIVMAFVKTLSRKIIARIAFNIASRSLILTGKVLGKIGLEKGSFYLAHLGMVAGEKAALKVTQIAGIKAGEVGGELAAESATAAATGPAAPFVLAAMLAFDVLSIGLDLGDAGGYNKMGTNALYLELRDLVNKEMEKAFTENGGVWPSTIGPMDKLSEDDYTKKINDEVNKIYANPQDPIMLPMYKKLAEDVNNKILSESDVNDDTKLEKYLSLVDLDTLQTKAFNNLCISMDGKVIDNKCSYKDKQSCESSYSWPLKEDSNEIYAEFKGDKCVSASYVLRGICSTNGLDYDTNTGSCKVDENYCKSKGADWIDNDCKINTGQNIAEFLFGTTITRGLKQIFDPAQYETCKSGEVDDGYFCRRPISSYGRGAGRIPDVSCPNDTPNKQGIGSASWCDNGPRWDFLNLKIHDSIKSCRNNEEWNGGLCYPKCDPGYVASGCCICSSGGEVRPKKRIVPFSSKNN